MAITQEEILQLTVSMFNASLGANYLADIESANFATTADLAAYYGTLTEFTSQFDGMTDAEQVTAMLSNFGLDSTNTAAFDYFTAQVAAGVSNAVTLQAADAYLATQTAEVLATYSLTDAAATLVNKTAAATYYSVTTAQSAATVADLKATVSTITEDVATVATANAAVDTAVAAEALTAATEAAAQAQYDDSLVQADADATDIEKAASTLANVTATTAATDAGATDAEIAAALVTITADNAATLTLAQIIASDAANTAVSDYLATVDTDVVDPLGDNDGAVADDVEIVAAADVTAALTAAETAYAAADGAGTGIVGTNTAEEIADLHTANAAALTAATTIANANLTAFETILEAYDLTDVINDVIDTEAAATAALAAENAAIVVSDAELLGAIAIMDATSDGAIIDDTVGDGVATEAGSVVTITSETGPVTYDITVVSGTGIVSLADPITDLGLDATTDAALITEIEAMQAELADWIVAINATATAVIATTAADLANTNADTAAAAADDVYVVDTGDAYSDAVTDLTTLQDTVATYDADGVLDGGTLFAEATLAAAKVDFDAVNAIDDGLTPLEATQATAAAALINVALLANGGTESGNNAAQDVSFITDLVAGDASEMDTNAIETDVDYLYVGTDFTVNTGAVTAEDSAVLEMFITEGTTTADTLLTFETFANTTDTSDQFFTVELTGVAVADVTVVDGLISF